jgi:S1-C subfamily serine protease
MDQFGVRKPALKALARTPSFAPPASAAVAWDTAPATAWLGAQIKSLTTVEEASAVGAALANGGILVLEVPAHSAAARGGLRPGDLIVGVNGKPVRTANDLQRLAPSAAAGALALRVLRDQAERTLEFTPVR